MAVLTSPRTVTLTNEEGTPELGRGTWHMAEDPRRREDEIAALRLGIDLRMTLIDTAEMYANGGAEVLVGKAIQGRRVEVSLVSKVFPQHAGVVRGTIAACDGRLLRLGVEVIDLYLLHLRGRIAPEETLEAFGRLLLAGKISSWGISNFDLPDMKDLTGTPGGWGVSINQVLYNPQYRGIEYDLLPLCERRGLPIMAYSPIEQALFLNHPALQSVAARHDAAPAQVALAWVLRNPAVCAIPRAGNPAHVRENRLALDMHVSAADRTKLDRAFPPPTRKQPLAVH